MTSCTIIISHFNSPEFLHACIRQIRKYENKKVFSKILIADQSNDTIHNEIMKKYKRYKNLSVVRSKPLYSGYGIDHALRYANIDTEYICQIHVDALPINKNWLLLPITILEENNLSFVGQLHFISKPTDTIYPLGKQFFSMSPTFNVARTETYREMALEAGFTRFHQRPNIDVPMEFSNKDWDEWAKEDYWKRGSDDDTVAFAWESNYRDTDKLGLAITGILSLTEQGSFGRIIEDVIFHFGFCMESKGVMNEMGEVYREWSKKIHEGYTDELINEMVGIAKLNPHLAAHVSGTSERNYWNGTLKSIVPIPEEITKRIEELKL